MTDRSVRPADVGSRRALLTGAAALVLLTLAAFSPVVDNGFVLFDDEQYITNNTVVKRGLTPEGVALAFTRSYASNWHPLTWLSHMVDVELFGLDPAGHHLMSVSIHAAAAVLLFLALRAMTGRTGAAFAGAALFAVHPLRVESVAWAAERKDVLCALFWTVTLLAWVRQLRRPSPRRYALAAACFALALMAKPMAVTLPLVLLLLDWWPLGRLRRAAGAPGDVGGRRRSFPSLLLEKAPLFALSAASALVTIRAQAAGGAVASLEAVPAATRAANALGSVVASVAAIAAPHRLAFFYPLAPLGLLEPRTLAAAAGIAAAIVAAVLLRERRPWLLVGLFWYLLVLLPVLGLVQVGEQARADRYTYLPSIGIGVALCWELAAGAAGHAGRTSALRAGAAAAIGLLVLLTMRQTAVWHDPERLFRQALANTADNWKAAYNLAYALDVAGRADEAEPLYREALRMKPGLSRARYGLAQRLLATGRDEEALDELRAAVAANPANPVFRMSLVAVLEQEGREEEAVAQLREMVRRNPQVPEAYNNLAASLAGRGERLEAERLLRRALEIDPGYREARANLEALTGLPQPGAKEPDPAVRGLDVPTTHRRLFTTPADR